MLILDPTQVATHRAPLHVASRSQFQNQPFLPESRRRLRPTPLFLPSTHAMHLPYASTTSTTALHSYSPATAMAAVTAVAPSTATTVSFLRLAIVFVAGGLFFSSAVAFTTASYAIGKDNLQRFREMAKIVWQSVWMTFTMGLTSTKEVLCGSSIRDYYDWPADGKVPLWKRYREAWRVLKCKLGETRRKAVEGVQAIQREVKMCAAAVGPPGLIPLQYMLDRQLQFTVAAGIEEALKGAVESVENIDLTLTKFDVGQVTPKLEAARVYDLGEEAMAFDYDIRWESELKATIHVGNSYLPSMPVTLHNVKFHGPVRVVMTPLTDVFPGFGAMLISFPSMPEIGLDIRVAGGEVTQVVPLLRAELLSAIENSIEDSMIWPKRAVVPSYPMNDPTTPILSATELKKLETSDPMLKAEEALGTRPVLRRKLKQIESDLLYRDQSRDEDLLNSIVDLALPSFQSDKAEEKKERMREAMREAATKKQLAAPIIDVVPDPFWGQLHQMLVDRHNEDVAKTHQMLGQSRVWKDMQKLQTQTKEKLEKIHWKTTL